ncbi:hypothetical protein KCU65_g2719, partial [Aureobasidium melanogenum]
MSDNINNTAAAGQRITFGTELEFITIVPRKIALQYGGSEKYLRSYLSNARVKLACNKPGCEEGEHEFSLPIHDNDIDETTDKWTLTTDQSVNLPSDRLGTSFVVRDNYGGLELRSRVQKFVGTSPCPMGQCYPCTGEPLEWSWRDEMRCFIEVIHEAFTGPGFCVLVNETTGLHVHLAHGDIALPVHVVQGLLGTMTALERSFDQVLPTNRITGAASGSVMWNDSSHMTEPLPGIQIDGFHALYKPGVVSSGTDFTNMYCPAISRSMFEYLYNRIGLKAQGINPDEPQCWTQQNSPTDGVVAVPALSAEAAKSIEKDLLSFNVPSWLKLIEAPSSGQTLKSVYGGAKYMALRLSGIEPCEGWYRGPPTVEVRTHAGSLDFGEISAWIDLLCSLARWAEMELKENVFSYLLESWSDAEYNICSLARHIGASESTIRQYAFVLNDDYARRRFEKYTSLPLTFTDNLANLNRANEEQRRKLFSRENVDEKIRWKLESGRYGPLPTSVLEAQPDSEVFSRPEAKFLHYNEESQKAWAEFLKNFYRVARKLDLTSKDSVDGSGTSSGVSGSSSDASDASSDVSGTSPDVSSESPSDGGAKISRDSDNESVAAGAGDEEPGSSSSDESDGSSESDESDEFVRPDGSDESDESDESDDESGEPAKSPVKDLTSEESEDDFNDEGWYGLHPGLAGAYNDIPGQHLTHLEETVLGMPALPSPTTPNMLDFEDLKTDTIARIHDAFFGAVTIESLVAAESKDEVENIIAHTVETQKQMHVLKSVAQEKSNAKRYLNKKDRKE